MVEKTQQEIITLKGQLKSGEQFWDKDGKIIPKKSINGDDYYSVPLMISETEKNGQKIDNQLDSIMLIFWKKNFDSRTQEIISDLQENQTITVHGQIGGRDNGLMRVMELETNDIDSDIFI